MGNKKNKNKEAEHLKEITEINFAHLNELFRQHNVLTQMALDKANETINERLGKMNEFREQQKDVIAGFATIVSVNALEIRIDQQINNVLDKINILINTNAEISNKGIAENSKRINEMVDEKNKLQGSVSVVKGILGIVLTILVALIITYLTRFVK